MKTTKLILAALAAVGLMASSASASFEETFDSYEVGTLIREAAPAVWSSNATESDDESKIASDGADGKLLELNTQGEILTAAVDEDFDGNYFSGKVKFVPHSSLVTIEDTSAKVAVYAYQEDDGEPIFLNIFHGAMVGGNLATTTTSIGGILSSDNIDDMHTLKISMRFFPGEYGYYSQPYAFQIEFDGNLVQSVNAYKEEVIVTEDYGTGLEGNEEPGTWFLEGNEEPGTWFLSACTDDQSTAEKISAICLKGTGLIDNLKIDESVQVVNVAQVGDNLYTSFEQALLAANGNPITILSACTYAFQEGDSFTVVDPNSLLTVTGTFACENGVYGDPAARILDVNYLSLVSAFGAAQSGDTIVILADATLANAVTCSDGKVRTGVLEVSGAKTLTFAAEQDAPVTVTGQLRVVNGATVTIGEDVTFTSDKHPTVFIRGQVAKSTLVVNGTVLNTNTGFDQTFAISGNGDDAASADITVNGTVSNANGLAIYFPNPGALVINGTVSGASAISIKDGSLTVNEDAVITATLANGQAYVGNNDGESPTGDAIIAPYYPVSVPPDPNGYGTPAVSILGGTISVADTANCSVIEAYDFNGVKAPADAASNVNVSGGTFNTAIAEAYCATGFKPVDNGEGNYGVVEYKALTFVTAHGTAPETQKLAADEVTVEPEAPTAEGWDFIAWFTDDGTFLSQFTFGGTISEDTTVYGSWTEHVQYVAEVDGTQYETFADAVDAANGAPITLLANCSYEFVAGKPFSVVEGDFKLTVTGVYAIDENGVYCDPVASIDTNPVSYYASLPAAFAAANVAETATTIKLLADCDVTARIDVDNEVTLDLNGKTVKYVATKLYSSGVFGVLYGAKFTVDDTSDGAKGVIDGTMCFAAVSVTTKQDKDNTANGTAELVVKNGTLQGHYYGITGNGQRHNTAVTVEGGTVKGLNDVEDEEGSFGIYNPQKGTLTIKGGVVQGQSGVGVKAGTVSVVDGGEIIATRTTTQAYAYQGSGIQCTGDAFVIDSCGYPGGDPEVEISGGTFTAAAGKPIASYTTQDDPKYPTATEERIENFVSGGTFNKALDEAYCATGFMPVENGDGTFGVAEYNTLAFVTAHGDAPEAQKLLADDVTVKPDDPTAEDYAFGGWFTDDGTFATAFVFGNTISEDTTIYAKWTSTKKFSGGDGTADKPYLISCVEDLQELRTEFNAGNYHDAFFKQTATIDMTGVEGWDGIGTLRAAIANNNSQTFYGTYDGGGFAINNIALVAKKYGAALFSQLAGSVSNLTVNIASTTGSDENGIGAITGSIGGTAIIQNVKVTGTIACNHSTGGFVAMIQSNDAVTDATKTGPQFIDCVNEAAVAGNKTGGFIGASNNGNSRVTMIRCVNKGTITATGNDIGGFVGYNGGHVLATDCSNTGTVPAGKSQFTPSPANWEIVSGLTGRADALATTGNKDGMNFATVSGNVATYVADSALVAGGTYLVTGGKNTIALTLADGESISFDRSLKSGFTATPSDPEAFEFTDDVVENVITYTCKAISQGYVDKDGNEVPEAIAKWAEDNGIEGSLSKFLNADLATAMLLNLDIRAITDIDGAYTFTVTDITVGEQVKVAATLDRGTYGLGAINGKLVLKGKAELADAWGDVDSKTFAEGAFSEDNTEEFTFEVGTEKFFQAEIIK